MPKIRFVDGGEWGVTWKEFYVSILPSGTPVEFSHSNPLSGKATSGVGVFVSSFAYDGINASIELYGGKRVTLFCYRKDVKIRRLKDLSRLTAQGCGGDGI